MARFLSIQNLWQGGYQTAKRFPLVLLAAILGSGVAIYMVDLRHAEQDLQETCACLIMACALGLTLFFSLTIFSEKNAHSKGMYWILQGAGLAVLVGYYFFLRTCFIQIEFVRYALINIAMHLLVSFAGFTGKGHLHGFWQFNKTLFLRFLLAAVYSATLYLGIALALAAVDQLFDVKIKGESYFRLWVIVAGIFNTWFFLAGVPRNYEELDTNENYPKGLKIFTQYVLLPLVTLYLLILYTYMGKIIATQSLPKGWVSYLVIGFSVAGILALLLIHPIRNKEGNNWIHIFSKWFYGALYPLVIMLFFAIGRRISDYGITENRYFIIVLAIWLTLVSTYFLFSKASNIKYIPISLCLIALLSSFGPWGAFSISENSQFKILEKVLTENKVIVDGKYNPKHEAVPDSVADQVTSIVRYFADFHGFEKFRPWLGSKVDSLYTDKGRWRHRRWGTSYEMLRMMNLPESYSYYHYRTSNGEYYRNFNFSVARETERPNLIRGYDYQMEFRAYVSNRHPYEYNKSVIGTDTLSFGIGKDSVSFEVRKNMKVVYTFNLSTFIRAALDSSGRDPSYSSLPQRLLESTWENQEMAVKLQFSDLSGDEKHGTYKVSYANGSCLLLLKKQDTR